MKVLSVKSPWAGLIADGIKHIENRTWRTKYRGTILIHRSGENGAIIARTNLISIISPEDARGLYPSQAQYIYGPWCWIFYNTQKLAEEIPIKGELGIWEYMP